ncbi:MAG TPA: plastocyanin/azurin family copper-binding protein [Gaiellaceae bacterium]|nr:plastocyanin/azurin family copper-binding protein [Gaiellaceae bacterium]
MTEKDGVLRAGGVRRWAISGVAAALVFLLGFGTATGTRFKHAALRSASKPVVTVTVTAGKPSEFSFTLSKKSASAGTVVFKVTNKGKIAHTFKICSSPSKTATANLCTGKVTKLLAPGAGATLTVTLKQGTYEYLCSVPGHAAAGMKGSIRVGGAAAPSPPKITSPATTTTATSTGPSVEPPATEPLIGDPVDGAAVFMSAGCGSCHVLAAAGATGNDGPDLDTVAPNQTTIVNFVTFGGGGGYMPRFSASLTTQQIYDVASYVYQSTHSST